MGNPSTWPLFNSPNADVTLRNGVVDVFLRDGFTNYVLGALQMHKYMLTSDDIHGYSK